MRKIKESRRQQLERWGCLPFEADEWSEIKNPPPYLAKLIMYRRSLKMNAIKYHWTVTEYAKRVRDSYIKEGLARRVAGKREAILSPWDLLRKYEDRYKDRHPSYETPTERKPASTRDFNYGALNKPKKRKEKFSGGKPYG